MAYGSVGRRVIWAASWASAAATSSSPRWCVWLGFDPKKAPATTAFIVIFSSLSGFLGKATLGAMDGRLVLWTAVGSVAGAMLGSWLLHSKLQSGHVKMAIGVILYAIAANMAWKLIAS